VVVEAATVWANADPHRRYIEGEDLEIAVDALLQFEQEHKS